MQPLNTDDIQTRLDQLNPAWALVGGSSLEREYEFSDFKTGLAFVNEVGDIAVQHQHHPDITLSWGKVTVSLTSHDAGGLTSKDFEFAQSLDALAV